MIKMQHTLVLFLLNPWRDKNTGVRLWLHMHLHSSKASFIITIIVVIVTTQSGVKSLQVIHQVS